MKSEFLSELDAHLHGDCVWVLNADLIYYSASVGMVIVPAGFMTDLASVPRVPIIYESWGNRCHREAVLHDYLYRSDALPEVSREQADSVFLEAMKARGVSWWIRWPMYWGVSCGGRWSYHQKAVTAEL